MGKPTGFMDYKRETSVSEAPLERIRNFNEFHTPLSKEEPVSYTHLRAHETDSYLVCRLLLEKKKT